MCMYTKQAIAKVAEKNILVTKDTSKKKATFFKFCSYFKSFIYTRFKTYSTSIHISAVPRVMYEIEEGFHSYITDCYHNGYFIIPKGACYFEGTDNDPDTSVTNARVSDKIIYIGRKNILTRLIARVFYKVSF